MKYARQILVALLLFNFSVYAQQQLSTIQIPGFRYGTETAPSGKEWESPADLSLNKEVPRAYFLNFGTVEAAKKLLPEYSIYYQTLNGSWKFNWVKTPQERPNDFHNPMYDVSKWDTIPVPSNWNIFGIQKDGTLKYGVPIYVNQQVIFKHTVAVDDWKGGVMRTPPTNWTTFKYRNEVGSYKRYFEIPNNWDGKDVILNFDGVDSFFYLWINGNYIGFSKNSRNLAAFNITKFLNKKGINEVAVQVYRNSDASFIEAQDMFRLPGIFRNVYLTARAKVSISNIIAIPELDDTYQNGLLNIKVEIANHTAKALKNYQLNYSLFENKLYSDEIVKESATQKISNLDINTNQAIISTASLQLNNAKLWSAEAPNRYTLVAVLKDNRGRVVETISTSVGFRKVEIKNTVASADEFGLAGRYYYVNGKTIKLKGVNRHETNPTTGKVLTRDQMENEIKLMKRANINHVRNSHYNVDPYWYYLCDKYGIYLEDEANIESHEYYYGAASLSHPIEWKNAHIARNLEMVYANINHPSIVIWSLGNEAGPGQNFVAAYEAIKKVDTSRPIQYERNNDIVDIGSNQYPSIEWVRNAVKGTYNLKYPFHISEYAHSMGNAAGNLIDYWEAIESTNFFMGGAIWDWIDQSMYNYDKKTGEKYLAYGGDFGDIPNDGTFVMNGLIFADLTPKPQYYEVKKVYQNVAVKLIDSVSFKIEIFNKNYFTSLENYQIKWTLFENGKALTTNAGNMLTKDVITARKKAIYNLPIDPKILRTDAEYFVKIQFLLKENMPWAAKDYVQMEEQIFIKSASPKPSIATITNGEKASVSTDGISQTLTGKNYEVKFDLLTGSIARLKYGNKIVIKDGEGPKLDALRAPIDNDNWAYKQWFEEGLHQLKHQVLAFDTYFKPDGSMVLAFTIQSQAPYGSTILGGTSGTYTLVDKKEKPFDETNFKFTSNQIYTVYKDGSIELSSHINSNKPSLVLPHIGYKMELPSEFKNFDYYGRGPINNYADRKSAQFIEWHKSKVADLMVPWPNPQSTGNREELRWCALTDTVGDGAVFISNNTFAASALPWDELTIALTPHHYQLPQSTGTHLYLNDAVTGLGGNSCGQGPPLEIDRVKASSRRMNFIIRPIFHNNFENQIKVSAGGDSPIAINRDQKGMVKLQSEYTNEPLLYKINNGITQPYQGEINLINGGLITAWYKNNDRLKVSSSFRKITTIPLNILYASSEENGEGNANHLLDGDLSTIWHSMYSITVAKYPHWIDFDAGETKNITGFKYTPRQDATNGNIKEYTIHTSNDAKNWGEPIVSGYFENNNKSQEIRLKIPAKARYIRFTAISSQNGQDFASGAEFSVLNN